MNHTQPDTPPPAPVPEGTLGRALALAEFLRARCPWDAAQTPSSLARYLLEEAHEVVHAITAGDDTELRGELGDLLLNLAFQVVLAEERGAFGRDDVVRGLEQKMRRRHPHLYGDGEREAWEVLKARERGDAPPAGALDGLPPGMDPLLRAFRVQQRAAAVGFDWDHPRGAWEKVREEVEEVGAELDAPGDALEDELGDLLFAMVNLVRLSGSDPVAALGRANAKFERRFRAVERMAGEQGMEMPSAGLEALDRLWDEAKRQERENGPARESGPAGENRG